MKANQTTTTNRKPVARPDLVKTFDEPTQPKAPQPKPNTTAHLQDLMNQRNELLQALDLFTRKPHLKADLEQTVHELCETIAQIAVYKTLFKLSDSPKDISTSGAEMCEKLYKAFSQDMAIYRNKDTTSNYSDAFDLFSLAYVTIWQYLHTDHPLTLDDIVLTIPKKNGDEKNYTLFQTACKSIREYIHGWSNTDPYKKLYYVIGITDNGQQVTTSKRPKDDLSDLDPKTITAFFTRHGLTAREQEIICLYIDGETAEQIAESLNLNLRMVQRDIKSAKAKFPTAQAYAELKTAENAERLAKAKALKNPTDSTYQKIWKQAEQRTATATEQWKKAFKEENRNK